MSLSTAVVGAGVVSSVHLSGIAENPRTDLVAVCDLDDQRARDAAQEYGITYYTDFSDMLTRESLDWVHICTPVTTHLDLATTAMEAGVPVLIEKPVTETPDEVAKLQDAATRHGVRAAVVHNMLYTPALRQTRKAIHEGQLGSVRGVDLVYTDMTYPDEAKRGSWAFDLPGGEFEEGLPHPIYIVLETGGLPASVDSINATTTLSREYDQGFTFDEAGFQYVTDQDTICSATMRPAAVPQRYLTVHGDHTSLHVDLISQTVTTLDRDYTKSSVGRAMNNFDRAVGRVAGTASGLAMVGQKQFSDGWETKKHSNSHYYLFDEEIDALTRVSDTPTGLERAQWTMQVLQSIRDAASKQRTEPSPL